MLLMFAYSQENKYELYFSYSLALALFLTFPRQIFLQADLLLMASKEGTQCASDSVQL